MKANLRVTQLSYLTTPQQIATTCAGWNADERAEVLRGIESTFRWAPVAQVAQSLFAPYFQQGGGVSPEATDMVIHGQIEGGLELMRQQNSPTPQASWGLTSGQQAALSYAWMVLKASEQRDLAGHSVSTASPTRHATDDVRTVAAHFCSQCGARAEHGARFCSSCGAPLH
jgi:hypothetical protein